MLEPSSNCDHALRIAVVASRLATGGGKVVGQKIISSLAHLLPDSKFLFVVPQAGNYRLPEHHGVEAMVCPSQSIWKQIKWDRVQLCRRLDAFQPDWVWSLGNYPIPCRHRQSVLIHDPHILSPSLVYRYGVVAGLKKYIAGKILDRRISIPKRYYCQTEVIRRKFAERGSLPLDKIGLCPPGIEEESSLSSLCSDDNLRWEVLLKEVENSRCTFFYPARFYPHKNHQVILDAFRANPEELDGIKVFWTIGDKEGARSRDLLSQVRDHRLQDSIINLGHISRGEVFQVMKRVDGLLMPTTLETFGIPFIEALQCGKPIITTDFNFTRAVCGDAAWYLEHANDFSQLASLMVKFASDKAARSELAKLGAERIAKMPTWHEVVSNVLADEGLLPDCRRRLNSCRGAQLRFPYEAYE